MRTAKLELLKNFFSFQGTENNQSMNPAQALPVATRPVTNQTPVPTQESFNAEKKEKVKETTNTGAPDYSKYYAQCHAQVTSTNYFLDRGLTPEIIEKFNLGYDPHFNTAVIPVTASGYKARYLNPRDGQGKYFCKGAQGLYNIKALDQSFKPVFIVEGEIDCLSFLSCGAEALGLGSTANKRKLIDLITERVSSKDSKLPAIFLALDNDKAGEETETELESELREIQVANQTRPFFFSRLRKELKREIYGNCKDANELLIKNPYQFRELARLTESQLYIERGLVTSYETEYISERWKARDIYCTGFNRLDRAIKITDGLYIIGAISSLGKTTFALQIADHIAESGRDVIIFSLEMSRKELIDKSICRMIFSDWIKTQRTSDRERLKNELEIQTLNLGQIASPSALNISEEKLAGLETNTSKYFSTIAKRTSIYESVGNVGVTEIAERVNKYVYYSGNKPLVIIDYLQLLAPVDPHFTDKQNTDKNVLELKRLSRELEIPIIAISSLNRANYNEPISMAAFKESGAIEYSSDVLLGLQLAGAGEKEFNVDMAKSQEPRQIELKILKNRRGKTGDSINFEYYASRQFFREQER
jgi:replicative DNA helicase